MSGEPTDPTMTIRLTRAQVREVDRIAIDEYGIPGVVLMENAARAVVDAALALMIDFRTPRVLVLCGGGNNGGDGLAAARHLHIRGAEVQVALTVDPSHYAGDALVNLRIVKAMGLPVKDATPELIRAFNDSLVIDAIFGTGLAEPPREPFGALVQAVIDSDHPVLAVDLPSGLDCDTGELLGATAVVAGRTVTFVAEKAGFANATARPYLGEVIVAGIGCPRELTARVRQA